MPDKKLTDAEIVKIFECCYTDNPCEECPAYIDKRCTDVGNGYIYIIPRLVADLINRLQAENEKLQKFKAYFDFYYGSDIKILGIDENGDTTSFDEFYNCAIANAESIEHHIAHIIKTAEDNAVTEFAESLKSEIKALSDKHFEKQEHNICEALETLNSRIEGLLKETVN